MRAASWPRDDKLADRLLVVDRTAGALLDRTMRDLPDALAGGDLLVVNDSATLPASLFGQAPGGLRIELRLLTMSLDRGAGSDVARWTAVLFGEGDHRTRTEDRPPPPAVSPGDALTFAGGLAAVVEEVSAFSARLLTVRFSESEDALFTAIYRAGRPVQYAYVPDPLPLWHVQTAYAARPWSVEEPSAGRSLTFAGLARLRERKVEIATLTHAAGLSATGDPAIDARLPLPERYDIPERTIAAIERTCAAGGRVIAVGTSVVRALEGCFDAHGRLVAGTGVTDLRLGPSRPLRVVTDLLTGIHEPGTSHFELLRAFASPSLLERAHVHAEARGYLGHELGDFALFVH
jgi:S-adenosylmethionine:tRNA ribosyltransferase-isomerase